VADADMGKNARSDDDSDPQAATRHQAVNVRVEGTAEVVKTTTELSRQCQNGQIEAWPKVQIDASPG
jgi:hypothetical protein